MVVEFLGDDLQGPAVDPLDVAVAIGSHGVTVIESAQAKSRYGDVLHFQWGTKWAVREGDWKLIGDDKSPQASLYNLAEKDPEKTDHGRNQSDVVKRLRAMHDAWAKEVAPN